MEYSFRGELSYENNYSPLVSAIVRARYSSDYIEALLNNYLTNPDKYRDNFNELQSWRAVAKERAKEILKQLA